MLESVPRTEVSPPRTAINGWLEDMAFRLTRQTSGMRDREKGLPPRRIHVPTYGYWLRFRNAYLQYLHGYATGHADCDCNVERVER